MVKQKWGSNVSKEPGKCYETNVDISIIDNLNTDEFQATKPCYITVW